MDFSLFLHMERLSPDDDYTRLYDEFVELALMAEAGGMRTLWTGEHHAMDFTISPNPFLLLSVLSQKTSTIRLGTGTVVAPFWHPIRLAGEAAMTDIISQGRLELGIARGAYSYEYDRLGGGMDAWAAGQHLREMIPVLRGLWAGDYAHDGKCWRFANATAVPKPMQKHGPPIWVAARDLNSFDYAIAQGCHVQVTPLWNGDDEIKNLMQKFTTAKAKAPEKSPKIMLLNHTAIAEDEVELTTHARDLSRFYNYFSAWFQNERPIFNGQIAPLSNDELAANAMFSPEAMRAQNVVGTPAQVIERLWRFAEMGFDEYSFWIDNSAPFARKKRSLELFIEKVMPNL